MSNKTKSNKIPLSIKTVLKFDDIDDTKEAIDVLSAEQESLPILQKIGPYLAGMTAFLIGLVLFFPLNEFVDQYIAGIQLPKNRLEFQSFDISNFGNVEIENLKVSFPTSDTQQDQEQYLKIPFIEGEISLWSLLFSDTIDARLFANSFELDISPDYSLSFRGSDISLIAEGENLKKDLKAFDGLIQFNAVNILGSSDIILPTIGEELGEFMISNMIAEIETKKGVLNFRNFQIESSLGKIQISGNLSRSLKEGINLTITMNPTPLFQKYSKFNLEYNLKNTFQILHDDGRLVYICQNSFQNCKFQKVGVQ